MTTGKHITLGVQLGEGADHVVFAHGSKPDMVVKVPKKARPVKDVNADMQACHDHFAQFFPWTVLVVNKDGSYNIVQRKIADIQHLTPQLVHANADIRRQFHALLEANNHAVAKARLAYDFFGLEGGARSLLSLFEGHKDGIVDKLLVTPGLQAGLKLKALGHFGLMPSKALQWWDDPRLEAQMANVVVGRDDDGNLKLYTPDIALLHIHDPRAWLHDQWNRLLMRQFFAEALK